MVKHAKTVCSIAGLLLLSGGFWLIAPAYGMIVAGIWCILVTEIGALGSAVKRKRDVA